MSSTQPALEAESDARGEHRPLATFFHVHLVSDSTGETLNAMLKATTAQFAAAKPIQHIYALVRSRAQMERTLNEIAASPGIVLYTIINSDLRRHLELRCSELQVPAISVLDPLLNAFSGYLGLQQTHQLAAQHQLDEDYFRRMEALEYTLSHDDGQMVWDLESADVVIIGVSRTSKTPTSMYLANRGIKAANVPLVPTSDPPPELFSLRKPFVVCLVASPERLSQIRESRLGSLDAVDSAGEYSDIDIVRKEIIRAKRLAAKHGWPVIDVTRKSVEETAAAILTKYSARQNR